VSSLRTTRLTLEPFRLGDLAELRALFTDPDVRRYLLDDAVVSSEWVADEIHGSAQRFADGSAGLWAVRETGFAPIVGCTGYRHFFEPPELQLPYGFRPSHWTLGLATEGRSSHVTRGQAVVRGIRSDPAPLLRGSAS
jgi:RimJ/RimL family protein N-acetyltransferase